MLEKTINTNDDGSPPSCLIAKLKHYGYEDVFATYGQLSREERHLLIKDIECLDFPRLERVARIIYRYQGRSAEVIKPSLLETIEPAPEGSVSTVDHRTMEERERWQRMGLAAISEGKLAVLLLSGGQGTRLGSSDPKGCFNIGLPSGKSLFQLQAERILRIQKLASQVHSGLSSSILIHWYIMTSFFTDDATRQFFECHNYFGLQSDQVTFFKQGMLPCFSKDGKFIMETPYKIAKAPDGNGGVYSALKSSRLLEDMAIKGIQYVDCYGVDNALVRVADPVFLGYFIDKGVAAAAKVVRKAIPEEKVGVFVHRGHDGPLSVIEYSELDNTLASQVDQDTGRLRFCWSNICLHMFTLGFLKDAANSLEEHNMYHLAEKRIPSTNGYTEGLKLEQFVFDAFLYSPSTSLFEVLREEEFAPVKNANGSSVDTPESARSRILRLHAEWVVAAGGSIIPSGETGVEVSPLRSYAGEDLESLYSGKTFHAPYEIAN